MLAEIDPLKTLVTPENGRHLIHSFWNTAVALWPVIALLIFCLFCLIAVAVIKRLLRGRR